MELFGSALLFWLVILLGLYSVGGIIVMRSPSLRLRSIGHRLGMDTVQLMQFKDQPRWLWAAVQQKAVESFILLCHRTRTFATKVRGDSPDPYYVRARLEALVATGTPTIPALRQLKVILVGDLYGPELAKEHRREWGALQKELFFLGIAVLAIEDCRKQLKLPTP